MPIKITKGKVQIIFEIIDPDIPRPIRVIKKMAMGIFKMLAIDAMYN